MATLKWWQSAAKLDGLAPAPHEVLIAEPEP